eukprot:COSAG05_NODE_260_length_12737_cov_4.788891_7_plen_98_part_00
MLLKIIGNLETMHDSDLPTFLIISLPIIFKRIVYPHAPYDPEPFQNDSSAGQFTTHLSRVCAADDPKEAVINLIIEATRAVRTVWGCLPRSRVALLI